MTPEQRIAQLEKALSSLVSKVNAVHASDDYKATWDYARYFLGPYNGPTVKAELAAAAKLLEAKE